MNALKLSTMNPDSDSTRCGQFSYTAIWKNLVTFIRSNVETKRHQIRMRTYGNCFTGCDLVDVVYHHLQMEKHVFTKTVTRDKANKVCQVLLDNDLIAFVHGSGKFDDSSSKLFRFRPASDEKENEYDVTELKQFPSKSTFISTSTKSLSENAYHHDVRKSVVANNCKTVQRRGSFSAERLLQRIRNRSGTSTSVVPTTTNGHQGTTTLCEPRVMRSSLPDDDDDAFLPEDGVCEGEKKDVEETDLNEMLMEECLSQLTALMDIPMLDSILQMTIQSTQLDTTSASSTGSASATVGNPHAINHRMLNRFESIAVIMSEENWRSWDALWLAGLQCLDLIPDGSSVLNASLSQSTPLTQKLSMYQGICDHYSSPRKPPLWSSAYSDIHLGIYSLLMKGVGKEASVLRALQLSLHLLEGRTKEEMKILLRFLGVVAFSEDVHISRMELNNSVAVSKAFARAFVQDRLLTDNQVAQLVSFMVSHADQLWDVPNDVQLAVDTRRGKAMPTSKGSTFCMKISLEEFNRQKKDETSDELVKMMFNILSDPVVAVKLKRSRLDQFRTHHPELFARHLSLLQF